MTLETLESYNYSSPTFFKNLQKLTDLVRRKYIGPVRRTPQGLRLLDPAEHGPPVNSQVQRDLDPHQADEPPADLDPQHVSTPTTGSDITTPMYNTPPLHVSPTPTDGITEEHEVTGFVPDHVLNSKLPVAAGVPDGNEDVVIDGEDDALAVGMEPRDLSIPETKRRTRFAGKKHVPVYEVELNSSNHKTEKKKES